jgi:hypothetical protein
VGAVVELSEAELALILESLDDAAYYRETRSRVLESSVRRASGRGVPTATESSGGGAGEHRAKARAYGALAARLRKFRSRDTTT